MEPAQPSFFPQIRVEPAQPIFFRKFESSQLNPFGQDWIWTGKKSVILQTVPRDGETDHFEIEELSFLTLWRFHKRDFVLTSGVRTNILIIGKINKVTV